MIEELLAVLTATSNIAVAVLVWRSIIADDERHKALARQEKNQEWDRALILKLLAEKEGQRLEMAEGHRAE